MPSQGGYEYRSKRFQEELQKLSAKYQIAPLARLNYAPDGITAEIALVDIAKVKESPIITPDAPQIITPAT